jgi:hypothetical protein
MFGTLFLIRLSAQNLNAALLCQPKTRASR